MNTLRCFGGLVASALCLGALGCHEVHPNATTSHYHPGPVVGQAVGTGVGVVAGNVAGVGVGFTEGVVKGVAAPFDPTTHVVRRWHSETTADGRTVQVPQDILVDKYGRPVAPSAPAARPAQPQAASAPSEPAPQPLASPKNQ